MRLIHVVAANLFVWGLGLLLARGMALFGNWWSAWAYALMWPALVALVFAVIELRARPVSELTWICTRCGKAKRDVVEAGCSRGPCPMVPA